MSSDTWELGLARRGKSIYRPIVPAVVKPDIIVLAIAVRSVIRHERGQGYSQGRSKERPGARNERERAFFACFSPLITLFYSALGNPLPSSNEILPVHPKDPPPCSSCFLPISVAR